MEYIIYRNENEVVTSFTPTDKSAQENGVMMDDLLNLSFTLFEYHALEVNDYVMFEGAKYKLLEAYRPVHKSNSEYEYNCKFYGHIGDCRRAIVMELTGGDSNTFFSYTETALNHLELIVQNINRVKGTEEWCVGAVVETVRKDIAYDNTYCVDALGKIAETFNTEWWIEGTTINMSRCEHGVPIELGYGIGLQNLSKENNEKAKFFTRLIPVGTTRNIDRKEYGYSRLQLPGGAKYIERNLTFGIIEHSEEKAFAHIYPKRIGSVGKVRSIPTKLEDREGFIYYFDDPELMFDPNEYEIGGLTKMIVFQSGELDGRDFEVNFHSKEKEFEIINQYPYDNQQLPGGALIPETGDKYILYNIRMPKEYYSIAENEYQTEVEKYLTEYNTDPSIYKGLNDYVYFIENNISLKVGSRVKLLSKEYFTDGYQDTRVVKIVRNVINSRIMDVEFSNVVSKSRIEQIENSVVEMQAAFKEQESKALHVLRSWDSGDLTDYNVLSSIRTMKTITKAIKQFSDSSDNKYLRKDIEDFTEFLTRFLAGIEVVGGTTTDKLTVTQHAIIQRILSSDKFISGYAGGSGWAIFFKELINAAGVAEQKSCLEVDEATVRGAMRIYEMIISQLVGENGTRLTTDMMRVSSIDTKTKTIYLDTEEGVLYNPFRKGDILCVQRFSLQDDTVIKQYELQVVACGIGSSEGVRKDWITYKNFVGSEGDVTARDVLVRMDSVSDSDRKGLIKHTSVESGSPYIDVLYGTKTDPENAVRMRMGRLMGIIDAWWGQLKGYGLYSDNAYLLGDFRLRTGEDVRTKFEILEGVVKSSIQGISYNLTEKDNFLTNATFTGNMEYWERESDISMFTIGGDFFDLGDDLLSDKNKVADVASYDGRYMLRLRNSFIKQENVFVRKPDESVGDLYLSFRYVCRSEGVLTLGFPVPPDPPVPPDEDEETLPPKKYLFEEIEIGISEKFQTFQTHGVWDGADDFILSFTGDIFIDNLALTSHPLEDYRREVSTLFEQTAEHIKAVAKSVVDTNKVIKEAGWITSADGNKLWADKTQFDELDNVVKKHSGSFHVTSQEISALVESVTLIDDDLSLVEKRIETAGWITAADGNTLFATKREFDGLGDIVSQHETAITQTAEKIELCVTVDGMKRSGIDLLEDRVNIYADKFTISKMGADNIQKIYATFNADTEQLELSNISAKSGYIGGFDIGSNALKSGALTLSGDCIKFNTTDRDYDKYVSLGLNSAMYGSNISMYIKNKRTVDYKSTDNVGIFIDTLDGLSQTSDYSHNVAIYAKGSVEIENINSNGMRALKVAGISEFNGHVYANEGIWLPGVLDIVAPKSQTNGNPYFHLVWSAGDKKIKRTNSTY